MVRIIFQYVFFLLLFCLFPYLFLFTEYLKIGDFVSFKSVLFNSYMSAEGILLEDVNVSNDLRAFGDCIFCIHLQRKYSASRELENYLTANKIDVANIEDEHTLKYFQALEV